MTPAQRSLIEIFCRQLAGVQRVLVNGSPVLLGSQDMKHYLAASMKKERRYALGPDGDCVIVLSERTSEFDEAEASVFIEFIHYYAATREPPIRLITPEPEGRT